MARHPLIRPPKPAPPTPAIRVVHVTPTLARRGGGVSAFVRELADHSHRQDIEPFVVSLRESGASDTPALPDSIGHYEAQRIGPRAIGYSRDMRHFLHTQLPEVDVVHAHGLRMYPSFEARLLAESRDLPLIISPHGQFDPWIIKGRRIRKAILHLLYESRNLQRAHCLLATSNQEARHIRAAGLTNPVAVLPIGIDTRPWRLTADRSARAEFEQRFPVMKGKRLLLFMSLVYPKKNLPWLAQAWTQLQPKFKDWHLVIAGPDQCGDAKRSMRMIERAGLGNTATYLGAVHGLEKRQLLACAELFVLPTEGENFGIVVAESLAAGTPVMTTQTTPWSILRSERCGWWMPVGQPALQAEMAEALKSTHQTLRDMGARGRAYVEKHLDWSAVMPRMAELYRWAAGRGERPGFVYYQDDPMPADPF